MHTNNAKKIGNNQQYFNNKQIKYNDDYDKSRDTEMRNNFISKQNYLY